MTDIIELIDAYAETRHRCGGIYNAKTEAARKAVIEALSGVQALSAAPAVLHEPTNEMYRAAQKIALPYDDDDGGTIILNTSQIRAIWHAMLAASPTPTPPAEQPIGEVVVTKTKDGQIVSVTRQDDEGRILSVIATSDPAEQQAITPETEFPVSAQGAAITSESGAVYAELPEGWPARFRCDSCDGNGEVGEPMYMGHFQPPERARCPDCDGRGWWSEEPAFSADHMRNFADRTHALRMQAAPKAAPGVGNSGFDHQTAADFLNGKTVSDEAVRKFVQAARWAHDEKAALSAMLLSVRGVLASREAEIALLKKALMEAEAAPQQEAPLTPKGESAASKLRAMAANYPEGHLWDKLDAQACAQGAMEIEALEAMPQQEAQEPVATLHCNDIGYVWARATEVGKRMRFEQPLNLYTAPQTTPAPLSDDTERLREALQRIEGASMSMYATRSDMLEHCQDIARAALAAQGGKA